MSIKTEIQEAMKQAMREKNAFRLECLRMAKGAILLLEKASADEVEEESVIAALRTEIKKRQQSLELFKELGKEEDAAGAEKEIAIFEEFLPKQLPPEELEAKIRAYVAEHPEINHAGKLTGALKKELGDLADGKLLNQLCRQVLEG